MGRTSNVSMSPPSPASSDAGAAPHLAHRPTEVHSRTTSNLPGPRVFRGVANKECRLSQSHHRRHSVTRAPSRDVSSRVRRAVSFRVEPANVLSFIPISAGTSHPLRGAWEAVQPDVLRVAVAFATETARRRFEATSSGRPRSMRSTRSGLSAFKKELLSRRRFGGCGRFVPRMSGSLSVLRHCEANVACANLLSPKDLLLRELGDDSGPTTLELGEPDVSRAADKRRAVLCVERSRYRSRSRDLQRLVGEFLGPGKYS